MRGGETSASPSASTPSLESPVVSCALRQGGRSQGRGGRPQGAPQSHPGVVQLHWPCTFLASLAGTGSAGPALSRELDVALGLADAPRKWDHLHQGWVYHPHMSSSLPSSFRPPFLLILPPWHPHAALGSVLGGVASPSAAELGLSGGGPEGLVSVGLPARHPCPQPWLSTARHLPRLIIALFV